MAVALSTSTAFALQSNVDFCHRVAVAVAVARGGDQFRWRGKGSRVVLPRRHHLPVVCCGIDNRVSVCVTTDDESRGARVRWMIREIASGLTRRFTSWKILSFSFPREMQKSKYYDDGFCRKLIGHVQLLGILAVLALGIGVGKAAAFSLPSPTPLRRSLHLNSLQQSSSSSSSSSGSSASYQTQTQPSDLEEEVDDDETASRSGTGQHDGKTSQNGKATAGQDGTVDDDEEEEARRQHEKFRAKPYEINVTLKIVGFRGSVPPAWLKDFLRSQGRRVKLVAEFRGSLKSIFSELSSALESKQLTSKSAMAADLVTIGDSWLSKAVSRRLIEPIEKAEQFEWYHRLGSKWQTFLRRDEYGLTDPYGKIWGVPYRWGSLVIAYKQDKLQRQGIPPIKDWADLWNPELAGKISMVASPREVVGMVLKALGASYNVEGFEKDVPGGRRAMKEKFSALQKQVLLFDDEQYLKTLGAEDVWVAVGWSEDVVSFAKRTNNIAVVAPKSGTSLWADLWAIPAATKIGSNKVGGRIRGPSPVILQWFDFCLQPARANSFQKDVVVGSSPLALSDGQEFRQPKDDVSADYNDSASTGEKEPWTTERHDSTDHSEEVALRSEAVSLGGLLTPDIVAKSEFLEPLSETALQDFKWLLSHRERALKFPGKLLKFMRTFPQPKI